MRGSSPANWLTALGTIAVAAAAIWGDWLKARLLPPRVSIEEQNAGGNLTQYGNGRPVMFFHFKVVNHRPYWPLRNCRVLLVGLARRGPDNEFRPVPMAIPFQLVWAPFESTPALTAVQREQPFDFGVLVSPTPLEPGQFRPALYQTPNDFAGFVNGGEAMRYTLRVEADSLGAAKPCVVQVAWDGVWINDREQMAHHVSVTLAA